MNVAKQKQPRKHIADQVCSCPYCTIIDVCFGFPVLTPWEIKFLNSVARQGWECDYSPKQKAVLLRIYRKCGQFVEQ